MFKINSSRLVKSKWKLEISLSEARKNNELISLVDSQCLRFIDSINDVTNFNSKVQSLKNEIKKIKEAVPSMSNKRRISFLYKELDTILSRPDYVCLIIDKVSHYKRACKGFVINGIKYTRLLGTNNGVKENTVIFVNEEISSELKRRIENNRNPDKALVPAKYESYKALVCSGSIPVSNPNGVLVVNDCETQFFEDIVYVDDENRDEPELVYKKNELITLVDSDGYGLILPSLSRRWSQELQLSKDKDYITSGVCIRNSFCKGMVYTFDFQDFANNVAKERFVKDVWGNEVDIMNVELILTASMLKLWSSYDSCEHYLKCCAENGYTFSVTKTSPEELECRRGLNYQFIQSYNLSDEQIDELIKPTVEELKDVLEGDYRKAILFLKGRYINTSTFKKDLNDFTKALMINKDIYNDPFVRDKIHLMIQKRIDEAKIGVLDVKGNYSLLCGDPYSLCQSIFGLEVTGLLKAGEIYNKFWLDEESQELVCFRAPMTSHSNIRRVKLHKSEDAAYWYRYLTTCTLFNSWDTAAYALNGADKDGDLVFLTDNEILVKNHKKLPTLMCVQRVAEKKIVTEEDLVIANINSFGDEIGKITNRITSMFDISARFTEDDVEYKTIDYRIKCGQLLQQNAIDKAKGIISKPMPKQWYNYHACLINDDDSEEVAFRKKYNLRIVANKKPYFMRYIYKDLDREYRKYFTAAKKKCVREFGFTLSELENKSELSEQERTFLYFYRLKMPVSNGDCVMNRICRKIEAEFAVKKEPSISKFDYSILKSEHIYRSCDFDKVQLLFKDYKAALKSIRTNKNKQFFNKVSYESMKKAILIEEFKHQCFAVCNNKFVLCNILLDLCYKSNDTKYFVWGVCGDTIIENLLKKSGGIISYPELSTDGDIEYKGYRFSMNTVCVGGDIN